MLSSSTRSHERLYTMSPKTISEGGGEEEGLCFSEVVTETSPVVRGTAEVVTGNEPVVAGTAEVVTGTLPVVSGTAEVVTGTGTVVPGTTVVPVLPGRSVAAIVREVCGGTVLRIGGCVSGTAVICADAASTAVVTVSIEPLRVVCTVVRLGAVV